MLENDNIGKIAPSNNLGKYVEWAPFETKDGVTEEQLLEASQKMQEEFLANQEGFIQRELLKGNDGNWVDLVYWNSKEDAHKAVKHANESDSCFIYFGLMKGIDTEDPAGQGLAHFEIRHTYN